MPPEYGEARESVFANSRGQLDGLSTEVVGRLRRQGRDIRRSRQIWQLEREGGISELISALQEDRVEPGDALRFISEQNKGHILLARNDLTRAIFFESQSPDRLTYRGLRVGEVSVLQEYNPAYMLNDPDHPERFGLVRVNGELALRTRDASGVIAYRGADTSGEHFGDIIPIGTGTTLEHIDRDELPPDVREELTARGIEEVDFAEATISAFAVHDRHELRSSTREFQEEISQTFEESFSVRGESGENVVESAEEGVEIAPGIRVSDLPAERTLHQSEQLIEMRMQAYAEAAENMDDLSNTREELGAHEAVLISNIDGRVRVQNNNIASARQAMSAGPENELRTDAARRISGENITTYPAPEDVPDSVINAYLQANIDLYSQDVERLTHVRTNIVDAWDNTLEEDLASARAFLEYAEGTGNEALILHATQRVRELERARVSRENFHGMIETMSGRPELSGAFLRYVLAQDVDLPDVEPHGLLEIDDYFRIYALDPEQQSVLLQGFAAYLETEEGREDRNKILEEARQMGIDDPREALQTLAYDLMEDAEEVAELDRALEEIRAQQEVVYAQMREHSSIEKSQPPTHAPMAAAFPAQYAAIPPDIRDDIDDTLPGLPRGMQVVDVLDPARGILLMQVEGTQIEANFEEGYFRPYQFPGGEGLHEDNIRRPISPDDIPYFQAIQNVFRADSEDSIFRSEKNTRQDILRLGPDKFVRMFQLLYPYRNTITNIEERAWRNLGQELAYRGMGLSDFFKSFGIVDENGNLREERVTQVRPQILQAVATARFRLPERLEPAVGAAP